MGDAHKPEENKDTLQYAQTAIAEVEKRQSGSQGKQDFQEGKYDSLSETATKKRGGRSADPKLSRRLSLKFSADQVFLEHAGRL